MSKISVAFGGILGGLPALPYASSGGTISRRVPPTLIPGTPCRHPAITCESANVLFALLSNDVPLPSVLLVSYSQPSYLTVTVLVATAVAPVPTTRSVCEYGALDVVGAAGVSLLQAASGIRSVNTSNRPGTVIM